MKAAFERHDVIIAPIDAVTAIAHDHTPFRSRTIALSTGERVPYMSMLQWIALATACGLPATAVPAGLSASGLPVGVQIIGPRGGDARTLAVAQAIDENIGGFIPPPAEGASVRDSDLSGAGSSPAGGEGPGVATHRIRH
jgi:amidase